MRRLLLAFLLGLLWLPAAARAGEEGEPERVTALRERLQALRAEVEDLDLRLQELEAAMDREEAGERERRLRARPRKKPAPTPKPDAEAPAAEPEKEAEAAPEDAPAEAEENGAEEADGEPGIDPAILEVAGTYELDREAFFEAMADVLRQQLADQDLPDDFLDTLLEQMRAEMGEISVTFVFETDLTWRVDSVMGMTSSTASGTWERDGEVLTLEQTYEDGAPSDDPQTLVGTWEDGVIRLEPPADEAETLPFVLVLVKVED